MVTSKASADLTGSAEAGLAFRVVPYWGKCLNFIPSDQPATGVGFPPKRGCDLWRGLENVCLERGSAEGCRPRALWLLGNGTMVLMGKWMLAGPEGGRDAGRRNSRGLGCEAQSQRPVGSVDNEAEC